MSVVEKAYPAATRAHKVEGKPASLILKIRMRKNLFGSQ